MQYLTIEKFDQHHRFGVFGKIFWILILLVVPSVFLAVWVLADLTDYSLGERAQAVQEEAINNKLTVLIDEWSQINFKHKRGRLLPLPRGGRGGVTEVYEIKTK